MATISCPLCFRSYSPYQGREILCACGTVFAQGPAAWCERCQELYPLADLEPFWGERTTAIAPGKVVGEMATIQLCPECLAFEEGDAEH